MFLMLFGCVPEQRAVTCEEIVAAYETEGFEVFHKHPAEIRDCVCYIAVENAAGESVYFHFFATAEEAEDYAKTRQYHALIWMFSVIYGKPTWVHTTTYGNIEIEYTHKSLYAPFAKLVK